MRNVACLSMSVCMLLASASCEAGGFFRCVPEVGEWASYDMTITIKTAFDKQPQPQITEFEGVYTLKCVGEEVIEDRRFLWIECRSENTPTAGAGVAFTCDMKMLVPEDEIVVGGIPADEVRGWMRSDDADPQPLQFAAGASGNKNTGWWSLMMWFGNDNTTETEQGERLVVVAENEVQLESYEKWPIPDAHFTDTTFDGYMNWWLNDDLAFGVASMDYLYTVRHVDTDTSETHLDARFDLVATGTDAASELPDHN